jgi:hypothetical protein
MISLSKIPVSKCYSPIIFYMDGTIIDNLILFLLRPLKITLEFFNGKDCDMGMENTGYKTNFAEKTRGEDTSFPNRNDLDAFPCEKRHS